MGDGLALNDDFCEACVEYELVFFVIGGDMDGAAILTPVDVSNRFGFRLCLLRALLF